MNSTSGLALYAVETIPDEVVDDFVATLRGSGVEPEVERREAEVFASVVWLMASSVVVFVGYKYLGALAEEAGKDHYAAIKQALSRLVERLKDVPMQWMSSGRGKLPHDLPGGLTVAVDLDTGSVIRFVFPPNPAQADAALKDLFAILEHRQQREAVISSIAELSVQGVPQWRIVSRHLGASDGWVLFDPVGDRIWPIG